MQTVVISSALVLGLMLFAPAEGTAQSSPLYIQFSPGAVKGALYKPNADPAPHVGILAIHRTSNFMGYLGCTELSKRGFLVLCMNPRFDNNEAAVRWEDIALDVRSGVSFLRRQPGISKVILWGFSGGGPTTTFYQAVAENGPSYCQGPRKLIECGDDLAGLPPADALILVDAHPGNSVNGIRSLNAAVTNDAAIVNDNQRARIDPDLDPFSPRNGYNPKGASTYSESFKKRYFAAQAARMNRLIDLALAKSGEMKKGVYPYPDDDAFIVVKGTTGRLLEMDSSIHHGTVRPQKLLKNDGTIARQIVESVRQPNPGLAGQDRTFNGGARLLTIRSFLSANAIRATDSMDDIDWCSSNNSTPCALRAISIPLLVTAMGGHYFIRDNEIHYDVAKSKDRDFVIIEGATHGQTPCVPCERSPGQYSNTVRNFFDYVGDWINKRF
ncbi:MAG TPA: hypothetical protein VIX63_14715 [Vicinamibacterales bacterium]